MSAELLRRAAALMRERAEAATPGPWFAGNAPSVRVVRAGHPVYGRPNVAMSGARAADRNFPHIASWHPPVALAVADLLTTTAWWLEDEWPDDPDAPMDWMNSTGETAERVKAALAVARAYLGDLP